MELSRELIEAMGFYISGEEIRFEGRFICLISQVQSPSELVRALLDALRTSSESW